MYIAFLLMALGIHYLVRSGLNYWLVTENIWPEVQGRHDAFGFNHIIAVVLGELYVIGLTSSIKFTADFLYERNQNQRLKALQYKTELKYLRAQIQPHFFFNTLNNIYALTMQKSSEASDVVLKLSDIMKYIIYDASKKSVSLLQEINYIDNYIELEKVRFGYKVTSEISITGNVDEVQVPPLLFLPFIENSFKHGLYSGSDMNLTVSFEKNKEELVFVSKNTFDEETVPKSKGGIGLKNIERRLQLLYDKDYVLYIAVENNEFIVVLKIPVQ
ncbi:sensor histidine kinase [Aquimarina hainanensis]|uniref:Sensor histidine kinase n=1 Tax=Aquimarina hainanensis TaxID=1578017 RepID=A0ABW5N4A1_9FLAO|nr:histidine kinase [Aquimarina sp. TRL1]